MITAIIAVMASAVLVGVDRLTKQLIIENIMPRSTVSVIRISGVQILNFTYYENTGAAFSILKDKRWFLIIISLVFIIGALIVLFSGKIKSKLMISAISLIIAGGGGNLIDRITKGYVVDFIDFRIIRFAVFNFADMCAVIGAFILFFAVIRDEVRDYKARRACSDGDEDE